MKFFLILILVIWRSQAINLTISNQNIQQAIKEELTTIFSEKFSLNTRLSYMLDFSNVDKQFDNLMVQVQADFYDLHFISDYKIALTINYKKTNGEYFFQQYKDQDTQYPIFDYTALVAQKFNHYIVSDLNEILKTSDFVWIEILLSNQTQIYGEINAQILTRQQFQNCPQMCGDTSRKRLNRCYGQCICEKGYFDDDCSIQATEIKEQQKNDLQILPDKWQYLYFEAKKPQGIQLIFKSRQELNYSLVFYKIDRSRRPNFVDRLLQIEYSSHETKSFISKDQINKIFKHINDRIMLFGFINANNELLNVQFSLIYLNALKDGENELSDFESFGWIILVTIIVIIMIVLMGLWHRKKLLKKKKKELQQQKGHKEQQIQELLRLNILLEQVQQVQQVLPLVQEIVRKRKIRNRAVNGMSIDFQNDIFYKKLRKNRYFCILNKQLPIWRHFEVIDKYPQLEETKECVVCLVGFITSDYVRLTVCFHIFHVFCIDQWAIVHQNCPFCRQSLDQKNLEQHTKLQNQYIQRMKNKKQQERFDLRHSFQDVQDEVILNDDGNISLNQITKRVGSNNQFDINYNQNKEINLEHEARIKQQSCEKIFIKNNIIINNDIIKHNQPIKSIVFQSKQQIQLMSDEYFRCSSRNMQDFNVQDFNIDEGNPDSIPQSQEK